MSLPPHLLNLQQKLNQLNLPNMLMNKPKPINEKKINESDNQINNEEKDKSKNSNPKRIKRIRNLKHSKEIRKKWKTLRQGGGVIWEDTTLDEWPDNDYRIFCGDLGNEVSDQILSNAFSKYQSFQKAKVVRDKNTGKSKGFGFVSLLNVNDYILAMREMNGKYVGNRPIKLKRSNWKDRSVLYTKSKVKSVKFKKKRNKLKAIQKPQLMNYSNQPVVQYNNTQND